MHLRVGIANGTKELDLDVANPDAVVAEFEQASASDEALLSVVELDGARTVLAVASILYFAIEAPERPGIGFAPSEAAEG